MVCQPVVGILGLTILHRLHLSTQYASHSARENSARLIIQANSPQSCSGVDLLLLIHYLHVPTAHFPLLLV